MNKTFDRRAFLKSTGLVGLSIGLPEWPAPSDKGYWKKIRERFSISESTLINMNSGSAGSQSIQTQQALMAYYKACNNYPFYQKVIEWTAKRKRIIAALADIINASSEEVCLTRNTTEGLQTIINGLPFEKGDEVISANSDYNSIVSFIDSKAKEEDLAHTQIKIRPYDMTDEEIISVYDKAISSKTRLILLTHIEHRYGRLLPVKEIIELAHSRNTEVLLDAAHSFGHYPHDVKDLNADYYATSLHKWFNAPYGTGLLYIRKNKIADVHPLFPYLNIDSDKIEKFSYVGTHASFLEMGIASATEEYLAMGPSKKLKRLQELTECIERKSKKIKGLKILRSKEQIKTGIVSIIIDKVNNRKLGNFIKTELKINTKSVTFPLGGALRISPNIYNTEEEIDLLISGIKKYIALKNEKLD